MFLKVRYYWPDLQNILRQSYDYLTIMPNLQSAYDCPLVYKTFHLQNHKIVGDYVRMLPYDIPKRYPSTL